MKPAIIILTLLLFTNNGYGQNLIPNPSFEDTIQCPIVSGHFQNYVADWFRPTFGTPDYYNSCATGMSVPNNPRGYQFAQNGVAYSGIGVGNSNIEIREYISALLDSSLIANSCYHFEMYVSLGGSNTTTDDIQIYFSDTMYQDLSNFFTIPVTPHIVNPPGNMFDSLNWTLVSGEYMAHGGESYIIIGNFNSSANSTYDTIYSVFNPNSATYLFIDNISLTPSVCTSLNDIGNELHFSLFPNPACDHLNIEGEGITQVSVLDVSGRLVLRKEVFESSHSIDVSGLAKGLYVAEVETKKGKGYRKFIKK